jgi:LCP family protein required for cell wall assembly
MTRRFGLLGGMLLAWVVGATMGTVVPAGGPSASASPLLAMGKVHAGFTPSLTGDDPIFILALGSDARVEKGTDVEKGLGDSIHIIGINPQRRTATILGFPRDAYVSIPGHGTNKINNALAFGGPELMAQTLENVTGIRLDYWVLTSFDGVKQAIDDVGGLVIDVPFPMHDSYAKSDFSPGVQRFKGYDVLAFSRDRHSFSNGDFARSENQGRVLVAALAQVVKEASKDPSRLLDWVGAGERNIATDLSIDEILHFGLAATQFDPDKVQNIVVEGSIGNAGGASIVNLVSSNSAIYRDMEKDAIVAKRNVPRSPTAPES